MPPIISIESLGKKYKLRRQSDRGAGYRRLSEEMLDLIKRPFRSLSPLPPGEAGQGARSALPCDEFWALREVSLDVRQGEVLGIIGRNGAGKSTLLKVLSRITEPTTGRVTIRGRVASLLEIGTGFHPELTGRENIFLNGAVLGMSRGEIRRKFDEIVAFAEVERFLDTPVKHYSSGMYVRLAFAVAAHLEPEILIVDEVLAVGDSAFQKKCLGTMHRAAGQGRTVLFVSHDMPAIQELCDRVIQLQHGAIWFEGEPGTAVPRYLTEVEAMLAESSLLERSDRTGTGRVKLAGLRFETAAGEPLENVFTGQTVCIALDYEADRGARRVDVGLSFHTDSDYTLSVLYASYCGEAFERIPEHGTFRCVIDRLPLVPGRYRLGARVVEAGVEADHPRDGIGHLVVGAGDYYGTGQIRSHPNTAFMMDGRWELNMAPVARAGGQSGS